MHPTATGAAKPRSLRPHLTAPDHPEAARGALAASACYLFWGLVPLYWKQLQHVDSWEIVAHRQVWSLVALLLILAATGGLGAVRALVADPRSAALTLARGPGGDGLAARVAVLGPGGDLEAVTAGRGAHRRRA